MRRTIAKMGLFVLLGLLAHLAVVLVCALVIDVKQVPSKDNLSSESDNCWFFNIKGTRGAVRVDSTVPSLFSADEWREMLYTYRRFDSGVLSQVPRWSRVHSDPADADPYDLEDARGWPLRSMRASFSESHIQLARDAHPDVVVLVERKSNALVLKNVETGQISTTPLPDDGLVRGGLLLPLTGTDSRGDPTIFVLPLTPIWPEFIANTVFYALALWLIVAWPLRLRRGLLRRDRHDRGECEACGYPIGESPVCTECGVDLHKQAAQESE